MSITSISMAFGLATTGYLAWNPDQNFIMRMEYYPRLNSRRIEPQGRARGAVDYAPDERIAYSFNVPRIPCTLSAILLCIALG